MQCLEKEDNILQFSKNDTKYYSVKADIKVRIGTYSDTQKQLAISFIDLTISVLLLLWFYRL